MGIARVEKEKRSSDVKIKRKRQRTLERKADVVKNYI